MDYKIAVTEDYEKLVPFFIENGLEFSEEDPVPTDLVKCWEVVERADQRHAGEADESPDDGRLIGGFVLAKREGEFIVDGIAVAPEYRKEKLGEALLRTGTEEARKHGAERIFLVARAPGFFKKYGFAAVAEQDAPDFFECRTCPQYGVSCFPEVMLLEL